MTETKHWWASKAVWGGVLAILAGLLGYFGYSVSAEDQETLALTLASIGSGVGGVLAIYGRIRAKASIEIGNDG